MNSKKRKLNSMNSKTANSKTTNSTTMNSKGQTFYFEAFISMFLLVSILIIFPVQTNDKNQDILYITSLEHDILKTHIAEINPLNDFFSSDDWHLNELEKGFKFMFSGKSGYVKVNQLKKNIGIQKNTQIVSSSAVFYAGEKKYEFVIAVFI